MTKTITLCDGFDVTFCRYSWEDYARTLWEHMDSTVQVEKSAKSEAEKQMELFRLNIEYREKPLALCVKDWSEVKPRLSIAGFKQIERELMAFSEQELVEGN